MKLMISKNKEGTGYYSKIQNDYNGKHTEKILSLQIPKQNNLEYGLYEVDGFLSTYEKKDGTTEFKFVVTNAVPVSNPTKKQEAKREEIKTDPFSPYEEMGKQVELDITDNFLDD